MAVEQRKGAAGCPLPAASSGCAARVQPGLGTSRTHAATPSVYLLLANPPKFSDFTCLQLRRGVAYLCVGGAGGRRLSLPGLSASQPFTFTHIQLFEKLYLRNCFQHVALNIVMRVSQSCFRQAKMYAECFDTGVPNVFLQRVEKQCLPNCESVLATGAAQMTLRTIP